MWLYIKEKVTQQAQKYTNMHTCILTYTVWAPLFIGRDLSKQFWWPLYNTKNSIFQLSFKTQSSSIYIFCLFCFCLFSQLLEFICSRVFSNQNLCIHNIQNILKYTENENLKHLQKFKLRLATGNFCQPLNHKLLVKLRA